MKKFIFLSLLFAVLSARPCAAADTLFTTEPALPTEVLERDYKPDGQSVIMRPDGVVCVTDHYKRRGEGSLFRLFFEGGSAWTGTITLLLVALLLAAWKAPQCVRTLGRLALGFGLLTFLLGCYSVCDLLKEHVVSDGIVWAGLRVGLIAPIYGAGVCAVSLVIRIVQRPRRL